MRVCGRPIVRLFPWRVYVSKRYWAAVWATARGIAPDLERGLTRREATARAYDRLFDSLRDLRR